MNEEPNDVPSTTRPKREIRIVESEEFRKGRPDLNEGMQELLAKQRQKEIEHARKMGYPIPEDRKET